MFARNNLEYKNLLISFEEYPTNQEEWNVIKEKIINKNQPEFYILALQHMASHACADNRFLYMLDETLVMSEYDTETLSKVLHATAANGHLSKEVCLAPPLAGQNPPPLAGSKSPTS